MLTIKSLIHCGTLLEPAISKILERKSGNAIISMFKIKRFHKLTPEKSRKINIKSGVRTGVNRYIIVITLVANSVSPLQRFVKGIIEIALGTVAIMINPFLKSISVVKKT
tara:strand:+ start:195 stop:524 length:330 start_codon:yes stop_codon:yes gene_type:complete